MKKILLLSALFSGTTLNSSIESKKKESELLLKESELLLEKYPKLSHEDLQKLSLQIYNTLIQEKDDKIEQQKNKLQEIEQKLASFDEQAEQFILDERKYAETRVAEIKQEHELQQAAQKAEYEEKLATQQKQHETIIQQTERQHQQELAEQKNKLNQEYQTQLSQHVHNLEKITSNNAVLRDELDKNQKKFADLQQKLATLEHEQSLQRQLAQQPKTTYSNWSPQAMGPKIEQTRVVQEAFQKQKDAEEKLAQITQQLKDEQAERIHLATIAAQQQVQIAELQSNQRKTLHQHWQTFQEQHWKPLKQRLTDFGNTVFQHLQNLHDRLFKS